ncbi:MAG: hypothetical protein IPH22_13505 [Nitrosomonas sp.]|nr:hypothetical protein [Nitrosomonas sp.]
MPYIIPNGTHTIMADVDDVNRFTESNETNNQLSQLVIVDGGTSPTVSITAPTGGVNVAGSSVTISASAADDIGVSGVQFMLDGANLGAEVTTPPYAVTWDSTAVADGPHIITAVARDADGNTTTSAGVSVTVANTMLLPDVIVTSVSYADGIFTSTVTNQGTAATPVGTAIGVGYSVNGNFRTWGAVAGPLAIGASVTIGTNGGPYIIPNGTHTIMADVDDVNRFTESNETNNQLSQPVIVDGGTSPTVSITAPTGGVNVAGSSVTISASAADDISVSGVQFKLDGTNLGTEVTTPPYAVTWDSTAVADGPHTITAVARDADGNTTTSAGVSVTVANTTPLPDVIVTSVSYADGIFTSTVTNQGTAATPVGKVIGVGYSVNGNFRTWGAVAGPLAVGASVTIGTNGGPYIIPNGTHTIMADVDDVNRFTESNETNNQLSQLVSVP